MSGLRVGELCAGYGGLGMGVGQVLDCEMAWYSEIDKGALKVLEHRFPGVPNIGDMTTVDWATVPPVDVLCAGYPCQPFSHAGKRKGTDDSRHLWPHVREAIRHLRPRLTVLENVSGHRSLGFDRVLGDLAEDGQDVVWVSVRASDVGAPHQRERLFIGVADGDGAAAADAGCLRGGSGWEPASGQADRGWTLAVPGLGGGMGAHGTLMPTPRTTDGTKGGPNQRGSSGDLMLPSAVTLLPTPAVNDMGAAYTPETWDAWTERMKAEHDNGNGHGKSLNIEAQRFPTGPRTTDVEFGSLGGISERWGAYAQAILRWERLTRLAPDPTMRSRKGTPQLSPKFSEWMMGLPAGWVTDTPGITRNEALRALGNGVVPQQAAAAVAQLLAHLDGEPTHDREREESR